MIGSLDWSILGPAFVAGLIVLSTHVPLGQEVLRRGIIFIDLAIAQVAGLGVIAAHGMEWDQGGLEVQLAAVSAALLAAAGLSWTEKRWGHIQEPLIGILFILAATGGILILAGNPHGSEHLKELLVGQILWQSWSSLVPLGILSLFVLGVWFGVSERLRRIAFYPIFAVVVTASVQIVGIYLVFASLIIPALATVGIRRGNRLFAGYVVGAIAYFAGIVLSFRLDLPTGAIIVWSMALTALLAGLLISDKAAGGEGPSQSPNSS